MNCLNHQCLGQFGKLILPFMHCLFNTGNNSQWFNVDPLIRHLWVSEGMKVGLVSVAILTIFFHIEVLQSASLFQKIHRSFSLKQICCEG